MTTTIETITNQQIRALRDEAGAAGDVLQAAVCAKALGEDLDAYELDDAETDRVLSMTTDEARAACARVIAAAEAQA